MNPPKPPRNGKENPADVTFFAESDYRNRNTKFGIKREDRTRHTYVIGKTGMGKTTLLENMAVQDIQNGNGLAFIDPHGEVADNLLDYVPEDRIKDVMYFAPFDLEHPISFNVMEDVGPDKRHLVADGLLSAFKKIWVDMWSGRMEYLLNNALLALLEYPDATILGVNRMFADKAYRKRVVANVSDVSVKAFWEEEYANYDENFARQAASAIQNKVGQFVSNPQVRNIVGQVNSSFDVRKLMDEKKIMLINLSKGQVGEDNARLIGSMLITKMYLAAMSRADSGTSGGDISQLPQFYFYVDEFQSFANESFAGILSEARKYKLNLTMAHQYIEQMTEDVRNAVIGNVGTMISFRVGAFDAEVLEKEFAPTFEAEDLVNLGFAQIYLKLMINGVSSQPFSARTLPPLDPPETSYRKEILEYSRETFGRPRSEVEAEVDKWHKSTYGIIDDDQARAMAERQREAREADPDFEPEVDKAELVKSYDIGQVVEGTITNVVDFGIFVTVEEGLEGLVHISELEEGHVEDPGELYEVGQEVTAQVIEKDGEKISLSIKALEAKEEEESQKKPAEDPASESADTLKSKEMTDKKKKGKGSSDKEQKKTAKKSSSKKSAKSSNTKSPDKPAKDEGNDGSDKKPQPDPPTGEQSDSKDTADEAKTASLKDLQEEKKGQAKTPEEKGPSVANKSKLQAALSKVKQATSSIGKSDNSKKPPAASQDDSEAESSADAPTGQKTTSAQNDASQPDEIPEDQLREMLAVDEEDENSG